jgi:hypothetical protein
MAARRLVSDTEFNEAAIHATQQPLRCSLKEPHIMRTQAFIQIIIGATLLAAASTQAAEPVQLDRVVISGKSTRSEIVQLPRVVVTGLSANSQMQQLLLAAAKPTNKRLG